MEAFHTFGNFGGFHKNRFEHAARSPQHQQQETLVSCTLGAACIIFNYLHTIVHVIEHATEYAIEYAIDQHFACHPQWKHAVMCIAYTSRAMFVEG